MDSKLYRGSLETIVVKLLQEHGEMYGYEITKKVKELTEGKIKLTEGALYPILHKMEARGEVDIQVREVDNRFRKYYSLTPAGKSMVVAAVEEMKEYLNVMQQLMDQKSLTKA